MSELGVLSKVQVLLCWIFLLSLLVWAKVYDEEQSCRISKQSKGIGKGVWNPDSINTCSSVKLGRCSEHSGAFWTLWNALEHPEHLPSLTDACRIGGKVRIHAEALCVSQKVPVLSSSASP